MKNVEQIFSQMGCEKKEQNMIYRKPFNTKPIDIEFMHTFWAGKWTLSITNKYISGKMQ